MKEKSANLGDLEVGQSKASCKCAKCFCAELEEAVLCANELEEGQWASLMTQTVKNLPAVQGTQVQSLGREDPLGKVMATHSSILAGEFHGQWSLVGWHPWGRKESDTTERLTLGVGWILPFVPPVISTGFLAAGASCA